MQALCQWDVQRDESTGVLADCFAAHESALDPIPYATQLVEAFWRQRDLVDARITATSNLWDLERISLVDRNILRVAVVELVVGDVPPRVVMDEAIEIGKEYGGADTPRFINGILDDIHRRLQSERGNE